MEKQGDLMGHTDLHGYPRVIEVQWLRDNGQLGLTINDPFQGDRVLEISELIPGGAIDTWNKGLQTKDQPGQAIFTDDHVITKVNGIANDACNMLRMIRGEERVVNITFGPRPQHRLRAEAAPFVPPIKDSTRQEDADSSESGMTQEPRDGQQECCSCAALTKTHCGNGGCRHHCCSSCLKHLWSEEKTGVLDETLLPLLLFEKASGGLLIFRSGGPEAQQLLLLSRQNHHSMWRSHM